TSVENAGILLLDPESDRMFVQFRRDINEWADADNAEVLAAMAGEFDAIAREMGGASLFNWLEDHASNVVRVTPRESVLVGNFDATLRRLYRQHVQSKGLPFRTHLPQYTLAAAAGKWGENMEVEAEGWVEIPGDFRVTDDMFVAHVTGHSMEPRIPDGSLCVFRYSVTGTRQGKLLLVMHYGETGENRFTIKRYRSSKIRTPEGWPHERITLEPLNPDYESWELTPRSEERRV